MDGRKNNGGKRVGAGRKPRTEETHVVEQISKLIDNEELIGLMVTEAKSGNYKAIETLMAYQFGKPTKEIKLDAEIESTLTKILIKD